MEPHPTLLDLKQAIKEYISGVMWYIIHYKAWYVDKDRYTQVAQEIGDSEIKLITLGVSEEALIALQDWCKLIGLKTPLNKMSETAKFKLLRLMYSWGE